MDNKHSNLRYFICNAWKILSFFFYKKCSRILIRYWKNHYILFRKAKVVINILHRLVLLPTWRGFFWIKPSASYYVNVNGLCVSHMAWVILQHLMHIFACYFPSFCVAISFIQIAILHFFIAGFVLSKDYQTHTQMLMMFLQNVIVFDINWL